jgi:hypothetical protein
MEQTLPRTNRISWTSPRPSKVSAGRRRVELPDDLFGCPLCVAGSSREISAKPNRTCQQSPAPRYPARLGSAQQTIYLLGQTQGATMNRIMHLVAAAAVIAAGIAISPLAHADDTWSSIAIEHNGERWGAADNYSTASAARAAANDSCQQTGAAICNDIATGQGCVSAARNGSGWTGASRPSKSSAEAAALAGRPGGRIMVTRC